MPKQAASEEYVSRAGHKLASAARSLNIDFKNKTVMDVGSSTGGFTDFALQNGASQVVAVDSGTNQLHPKLRNDSRVELHEKTDIRDFEPSQQPDIVVVDVSFISLKKILPHIAKTTDENVQVVAMVKPQFEAENESQKHKGVIKNDAIRREILKSFEQWVKKLFVIQGKADSMLPGTMGNLERFYLLRKAKR